MKSHLPSPPWSVETPSGGLRVLDQARHRAVDHGITLSEWVNRVLRDALQAPAEQGDAFDWVTFGPGPRHLELLDTVCRAAEVAGADVSDAQHAAAAIEHGCTLVTRDRGFSRFEAVDLCWEHLDL